MTVLAAALFGVLALSPVWLAWWVRRHPRPLRKPGAAWVGLSVTIATCWLGVLGFYLFFVRTDTASGGHPLAAIITLVVLALAVVLGITGSTILWRAERSAQTRNAALGLATGRRWWPNWLEHVSYMASPGDAGAEDGSGAVDDGEFVVAGGQGAPLFE